ncbi:hypothetical protein KVH15_37095 [Streptomyces olivaceus]|uniref:hypothetical protein n=1 Tax=Streptomyces olivaceus TaxID=47716 RepID=UPI001CCD17E8|nr:hypothetical protein [Streptomyces olivaceus]MBZ6086589.1 hypothetical protein [Streptomyces olivaceus]
MTEPTTTSEWNTRYPIGTSVIAYPGARPEDDPTSHVEQQVQARIQAARVKIQGARQQRDELGAARRRGLAARHANKLWRQAERRAVDQERRDGDALEEAP